MKKGQSEMVGFAVILIMVTVLLMIFLSFSTDDNSNNYEDDENVRAFIDAAAMSTTACEDKRAEDYVELKELILMCKNEELCYDETDSCEVMNNTIDEIFGSAFKVGEDFPNKGYSLKLMFESNPTFYEKEDGIKTRNKEVATITYPKGEVLGIQFTVYK